MIESITTLTPAQQVATAHAQESEVNRLAIHDSKKSNTQTKNSDSKRQGKNSLTEFERVLQNNLAETNQSVHISVDDVTKRIVVKIVDNSTNEVVKQLPTEEMLKVSRNLVEAEQSNGTLKDAGNITDTRI